MATAVCLGGAAPVPMQSGQQSTWLGSIWYDPEVRQLILLDAPVVLGWAVSATSPSDHSLSMTRRC